MTLPHVNRLPGKQRLPFVTRTRDSNILEAVELGVQLSPRTRTPSADLQSWLRAAARHLRTRCEIARLSVLSDVRRRQ